MGYYLVFDGVDDNVDLASPISASGDGVLAEIDFVYSGASNDVICGGTSFSDYWRIDKDNQFRISIAGTSKTIPIITSLVPGTRYTLRLVREGSLVTVEDAEGIALTTATSFNADPFIIKKIGSFHNGSSNLAMDLYGFKANNGANNYNKQTLSGSNDNIYPDTVGGNEGTLFGFPDNNSQWVFFEDGGGEETPPTVTGSVSVDGLSVTGAVSSDVDAPALTGSVSVNGLSVTGVLFSDVDAPALTGSVSVDGLSVTGSAAAETGQPTVTGSVSVDGLSVTGSVSSDVDAPALTGSVSIDGLSVTGSVSVSPLGPTVTGSVSIDGLSVTGSLSSDVDAPALTGSVSIDGLSVTGILLTGLFNYPAALSNTLEVSAGSNILTAKRRGNILQIGAAGNTFNTND